MPTLSLNASKKTKNTPAGEIPVDWGWAELSQIVAAEKPIVYGIVQAGPNVADGVPYIRSTDVGARIDTSLLLRTSNEIASKYKRSVVAPGDIIFSLRGNIGEVSVVPTALPCANLTQGTARISVSKSHSPDYIHQALVAPALARKILTVAKGSTFREITLEDLRSLAIPLPPLPEQIRIAAILSTWDRAIETLESLIAAKDRRKQALMQQLLTGKKRLPGFGGKWQNTVFGDFLTESRLPGSHGASARKLTVRLYGRGISEKSEVRAGSSNTRYYTRRSGQLIYSKLDFLNGAFAIIPSHLDGLESTLDLPAFNIAPTVNPRWILTYLTRPEFYENCVGFAAGGRKARRVNPNQFLNIHLKLPPLPEQNAIAAVLDTADRELALHRQHLATLRTQKRGMMQKLLTGEIRTLAS